jgi:type IV pilus assembly protein PilQ
MKHLLIAVVLAFTATAAQAGPRADGGGERRITIDMQDAEIGNVLRLLADVSGKNLVYGEEVKGKITLKLKNVPWSQALKVVLQTKGLGAEHDGNVIRIATQDTLDKEEQTRLDVAAQRELKGPLFTRVIPVNYASAKEMAERIKPMLSPRGTLSVDERTNTIIVRDVRGSGALRY